MPVNTKGVRIAPGPYDRNDGFSPGSTIVLHVPGLDNAAALKRTGAVPLTNMAQSLAKRQPIVLIDQATGQRQLIWAELDANAKSAGQHRPADPSRQGCSRGPHLHRRSALPAHRGRASSIAAPQWFARLRDGGKLPAAERSQRARYAAHLPALKRAGIARNRACTRRGTSPSPPGRT